MKALTPYERWMVKSNLETIRQGTPAADQVAILRANGYPKIADAVEAASADDDSNGSECQHSSNEPCMICSECGRCSESLDETDVCAGCRSN
jgi:hypothetical protein